MSKNELTGKPALMKELNIGLIKDALAKYQKATRVELAAITGISQPTVNMLMKQLVKEHIVVSEGMAQSTGGRKAEVFSLNRKRSSIVSIIVQKNEFEYVITDMELNEEHHECIARNDSITYLDQLVGIISHILSCSKYVRAITVGVPGAVSASGEVFAIPQIPEWEHLKLRMILEREFTFPVTVMNDINAVAVGYSSSFRHGTHDMVYLYLGSDGTGAGIIIDGKLYNGSKSFAGEVGFMQADVNDPEVRLQALEKIVTGIICILNPEKIVIGGDNNIPSFYERIITGAVNALPGEIVPQFERIESGIDFYFKGLGKMGQEILDEDVRLA